MGSTKLLILFKSIFKSTDEASGGNHFARCTFCAAKCASPAAKCASPVTKCASPATKCAGPAAKCASPATKCASPVTKCASPATKCGNLATGDGKNGTKCGKNPEKHPFPAGNGQNETVGGSKGWTAARSRRMADGRGNWNQSVQSVSGLGIFRINIINKCLQPCLTFSFGGL